MGHDSWYAANLVEVFVYRLDGDNYLVREDCREAFIEWINSQDYEDGNEPDYIYYIGSDPFTIDFDSL